MDWTKAVTVEELMALLSKFDKSLPVIFDHQLGVEKVELDQNDNGYYVNLSSDV